MNFPILKLIVSLQLLVLRSVCALSALLLDYQAQLKPIDRYKLANIIRDINTTIDQSQGEIDALQAQENARLDKKGDSQ